MTMREGESRFDGGGGGQEGWGMRDGEEWEYLIVVCPGLGVAGLG